MNCHAENRFDFLETKMRCWWELAVYGLTKHDRTRSRRNFLHLARRYPLIAYYCGFSEEALDEWQAYNQPDNLIVQQVIHGEID